jgi:hypothetical protein
MQQIFDFTDSRDHTLRSPAQILNASELKDCPSCCYFHIGMSVISMIVRGGFRECGFCICVIGGLEVRGKDEADTCDSGRH